MLVGLEDDFDKEYQRISTYLAENVEVTRTINMTYSQAMFFSKFSSLIGVDDNIDDRVGWFERVGGICLKGRLSLVDKGNAVLVFDKFVLL